MGREKARKNLYRLFIKQRGLCAICGQPCFLRALNKRGTVEDNAFTLGHILPKAYGGTYRKENIQGECRKCNTSKGANFIKPLPSPFE